MSNVYLLHFLFKQNCFECFEKIRLLYVLIYYNNINASLTFHVLGSASTVACVSSRSQPHVIKMVKSRFIVDCMGRRLDVAFVLDSSQSVEEKNWEKIVDFVALMTHKMALENGLQRAGLLISIQTQRVILIFSIVQ